MHSVCIMFSVVVTSDLEVPGNRSKILLDHLAGRHCLIFGPFLCMLNLMTTFDIKVLSSLWYLS